jgi:hypothetical protein
MSESSASTVRALRLTSIFALLVAIGVLIAIIAGKADLPAPIPLMLLIAGLSLNIVASAKAKRDGADN